MTDIDMYQRAYWDIQKVLDKAIGIDVEDGAGEGIVADVQLIVEQRDANQKQRDALLAKVDELTAERDNLLAYKRSAKGANADLREQLTAANRRADGLDNDLRSAVTANTAWANQTGEAASDGPWKALIVHESWVADDFSELATDDEVDIVIVRDSALPDDEGHMPGTYKTDDVAFEAEGIYVDGDGGTDAPTIYTRAQIMAAGLNAAERVAVAR